MDLHAEYEYKFHTESTESTEMQVATPLQDGQCWVYVFKLLDVELKNVTVNHCKATLIPTEEVASGSDATNFRDFRDFL